MVDYNKPTADHPYCIEATWGYGKEGERIANIECRVENFDENGNSQNSGFIPWRMEFFIESKTALDFLSSSGIKVDTERQYAFISKKQVEDAISFAPKEISLYTRTGQKQADLHSKNLYCVSGQTANYIIDINSGKRREGVIEDVADFTRLSDSLENITAITQAVVAHDVPGAATIV